MKESAGDLAGLQRLQLGRCWRFVQLHADAGIAPVEVAQDTRQHRRHRQTGEGHAHMPGLSARERLDIARHRRQRPEQRLDAFQQSPAGRSQLDLAPRAVEQVHAQRRLQLRNAAGERRLRHGERLRRLAEMQLPRHLAEVNEVPEFERILILTRHHRTRNKYFRLWQDSGSLRSNSFQHARSPRSTESQNLIHSVFPSVPWSNHSLASTPPMPKSLFEKVWDAHTVRHAGQRPDAAAHRHAPHPRGHQPAGLRHAARPRPEGRSCRSARSPRSTTSCRPTSWSSRYSDPLAAGHDGRAAQELRASSASPSSTAPPASRASSTSSVPSRASPSRARRSPAATPTPRTHGAFGAIAFGIGTSQVRDVLATQTMALGTLKVRRINVNGKLRPGRLRQGRHSPHHPHARRERRHRLRLRIRRRGLRPLHRWKSA